MIGSLVGCTLLLLALSSSVVEGRYYNVTFSNLNGQFILQSPNWPGEAPLSTNDIWELTAPEGMRVVLTCPDIALLKRVGCTEGSLTIWDGLTQMNICIRTRNYQRKSAGNKMFVQFRSGWTGIGRFRCVARLRLASSGMPNAPGVDEFQQSDTTAPRQTNCPCGWVNRRRIVGGTETGVNEYVFPVSIKFPHEVHGFCGGSIITRRHVLTAAHCLVGITGRLQVIVGDHNLHITTDTNATQVIEVLESISHGSYDNDEMVHDIAILFLARDIQFNQLVGPVCLPSERYDLINKSVKVLGWGSTSTDGDSSPVLLKVDLQVVELSRCANSYTNFIDVKNPRQFCTFESRKDSCQGDSGGPLVYWDEQINRYVQVGIVSYGKDCASDDPAVNIDVRAYYNWIQNVIQRYRPQVTTCEKV